MKLISMTDFVLEQEQPTYLEKEEFEDVYYKILAVQASSLLDLSHCLMYNISVY